MKFQLEIDLTQLEKRGGASPANVAAILKKFAGDMAGYKVVDNDLAIDAKTTYPMLDEWLSTINGRIFVRGQVLDESFDTRKLSANEVSTATYDANGNVVERTQHD